MWRMAIAQTCFFGGILAAVPAMAATNIECMSNGYSHGDQKILDETINKLAQHDLDSETGAVLKRIFSTHANECAKKYDWGADAIYHAINYQLSVATSLAVERGPYLTAAQISRLRIAVVGETRARLQSVLGPGVEAAFNGQAVPAPSREDLRYLGSIVLSAGLPTDDAHATVIGGWLSMIVMQQISAEKFAKS